MLAWILKTKPEKSSSAGVNLPADRFPGAGWRCHLDKTVEHLPDTEIIDGAAKKNRSLAGLEIMLILKGIRGPVQKFDVFPQVSCGLFCPAVHQPWGHSDPL